MRRRILLFASLSLVALGAAGFKQGPTDVGQQPYNEKQVMMLGLMRTINTFEVGDLGQYGSYSPWPVLLKHNSDEFDGWLARWAAETKPQQAPLRFSNLPEILPGVKLRLNLNADGRGYSVLIEDIQDKHGFAFVSDERGIIRECKDIH